MGDPRLRICGPGPSGVGGIFPRRDVGPTRVTPMICGPALPPDTGPGIGVTCFEFARSGGPMSVNPHIFRLTELHRRLDDALRHEARRRGGAQSGGASARSSVCMSLSSSDVPVALKT